jgi:tetratricopeptide (TPR) repeat protein
VLLVLFLLAATPDAGTPAPKVILSNEPRVLVAEARELRKEKKLQEAKLRLEECRRIDPTDSDCVKYLAAVWQDFGKTDKAYKLYKQWLTMDTAEDPDRRLIEHMIRTYEN